MSDTRSRQLWLRTRRLTALLLAIWLLASLAGPWFARPLDSLQVLGVPLGYWLVAQGFMLLYLLLIIVYVVWMSRIERRFRDAAPPAAEPKAPE